MHEHGRVIGAQQGSGGDVLAKQLQRAAHLLVILPFLALAVLAAVASDSASVAHSQTRLGEEDSNVFSLHGVPAVVEISHGFASYLRLGGLVTLPTALEDGEESAGQAAAARGAR